jgi:hypothetical protein
MIAPPSGRCENTRVFAALAYYPLKYFLRRLDSVKMILPLAAITRQFHAISVEYNQVIA